MEEFIELQSRPWRSTIFTNTEDKEIVTSSEKTPKTVLSTELLKCDFCTKTFSKVKNLVTHWQLRHRSNSLFRCKKCKNKNLFVASCLLKRHLSLDHKITNPKTLENSMQKVSEAENVTSLEEIQNIIEAKTTNKEGFQCDLCLKIFKPMMELELHVTSMHPELTGAYKCNICSKGFGASDLLSHHITRRHKESEVSISIITYNKCDFCPTIFETISQLELHVRSSHTELTDAFQCNFCNAKFGASDLLEHHITQRHRNDPKSAPYTATTQNVFEKGANGKEGTNDSRFKCDICIKRVKSIDDLEFHVSSSHPELISMFQCSFCEVKFGASASLENHAILRHKTISKPKKHKLFELKSLKSSKEKYTDRGSIASENRIKCDFCDTTFVTLDDLELHIRSSHTDQANTFFNCDKCNASFAVSVLLAQHVSQWHSNDTTKPNILKIINNSCFKNDPKNDEVAQLKEESARLREENRKKDLQICKILKLAISGLKNEDVDFDDFQFQITDMVTNIEKNYSNSVSTPNSTIFNECQIVRSKIEELEKFRKICSICNKSIRKDFLLTHKIQEHTKPSFVKL